MAEKADKNKPTQIEANRMSSDDARRISIFEGNVVLTKGTILVRADRIVVRQDAEGFQFATATGRPARFRQKADPKGDKEGVWSDGEALRVEIDDRNERIELFERARVTRDQDEVCGEYIFLDQRTEFFSVSAAKGAPATSAEGRVRAVIQPKVKPEAGAPAAAPSKALAADAARPCLPGAR
ncbi:MAG: lipopolysaccharide transport periplasmic protein LptA [Burkholderiales bacterium]